MKKVRGPDSGSLGETRRINTRQRGRVFRDETDKSFRRQREVDSTLSRQSHNRSIFSTICCLLVIFAKLCSISSCNITAFGNARKLPNGLASTSDCTAHQFLSKPSIASNTELSYQRSQTTLFHNYGKTSRKAKKIALSLVTEILEHESSHSTPPGASRQNPPSYQHPQSLSQPCPNQSPNLYPQAKIHEANVLSNAAP